MSKKNKRGEKRAGRKYSRILFFINWRKKTFTLLLSKYGEEHLLKSLNGVLYAYVNRIFTGFILPEIMKNVPTTLTTYNVLVAFIHCYR